MVLFFTSLWLSFTNGCYGNNNAQEKQMKIKFICGDRHVAKHYPPVPTAKARPDWYNRVPGFLGEPLQSPPTVKKCNFERIQQKTVKMTPE